MSAPVPPEPMFQPSAPVAQQQFTGQYTTVIRNQEMPRDYFIWSLMNLLYCNPCMGVAALVHSVKARDMKVVGDVEAARSYSSTARTLNIVATAASCLILFTIFIVLIRRI